MFFKGNDNRKVAHATATVVLLVKQQIRQLATSANLC